MSEHQPAAAEGAAAGDVAAPPAPAGPARHRLRRVLAWCGLIAVSALGAAVGAALAPGTTTYVGPLQTQVHVRPSLSPGIHIDLPPAGQVAFDTHWAPVLVTAQITSVDLDAASRLLRSPQQFLALEVTAADAVRAATLRAAAYSGACSLAGAAAAGLLVYRGARRTAQTTGASLAVVLVLGTVTAATFDAAALSQPRFTGLLSRAPYIVTNTRNALDRLESYRSGLSQIVRDVSSLYAVSANLPVQGGATPGQAGLGQDVTTVLHISDVHLNPLAYDLAQSLLGQFDVDAVVDTGDVTTWGSALESTTLQRIGALGVPYVFVRGNHDSQGTADAVAQQPGAVVLDGGEPVEVAGLRFAGIGDPRFTPASEGELAEGGELEVMQEATERFAATIEEWDEAHPDDPVDVAVLHNPSAPEPLHGRVPLVLAGHLHKRSTTLDEDTRTRLMVQGTTGGGGLSSAALVRFSDGEPLPMSATLLHFARSGERAGRLVAYDEVTVGGLGLASVQLRRTVVDRAQEPAVVASAAPAVTSTGDVDGATP
ncbi:DNA repair exonuclease SbcCD nuclease subunit [Kineococcus xinjiangensis]|uniref:DNA repair exonuclease SbcCD nuclease subunit n=1 Tax=Kineococcus xinjiangensis TaxID=512762 RepID=A0A2S6ICX4_9ACTN|nr:metallophosphoesterase [Kineococcus xinjiangensis]PPK92072.1 DNA repair exonuclease SbcCD nuclease subunit [Kineococcus xinjiangensis]